VTFLCLSRHYFGNVPKMKSKFVSSSPILRLRVSTEQRTNLPPPSACLFILRAQEQNVVTVRLVI
jgi:hypothetical protein